MKSVRTFIGIFPPSGVQSAVAQIQTSLKIDSSPVRWEIQSKFHITLKFLGNISPAQSEQVRSLLMATGLSVGRFEVLFTRVGCFPTVESPKIVWIGSSREENAPLSDCSAVVDHLCVCAGFKTEERAFLPHMTLGRVKGKISRNLLKRIENTTFVPIQFLCTELLVMKSDLSPSGSAYSQLFTIPLKQ